MTQVLGVYRLSSKSLDLVKKQKDAKTTRDDQVSLINNFPAALWKKITVSYVLKAWGYYTAHKYLFYFLQLFINGVEVTHNTSTNYAYKTWLDVMASFSPEVKKHRLEDGGSYFFQPESKHDFEENK